MTFFEINRRVFDEYFEFRKVKANYFLHYANLTPIEWGGKVRQVLLMYQQGQKQFRLLFK